MNKNIVKYLNKNNINNKNTNIDIDMHIFEEEQKILNNYIIKNIKKNINKECLQQKIFYALEDGKKIRPIIMLSIYKKIHNILHTNDIPIHIINIALSLEYVHCSSLIFDDIMDDDEKRRNKLTIYKKYGLANAQIIGITLCMCAIKNTHNLLDEMKENKYVNENTILPLSKILIDVIMDLCDGQYMDINKISIDIEELMHKKTSSLFTYCFIIPFIIKNNNNMNEKELLTNIQEIKKMSKKFGLLYQISDDFEDYDKDNNNNDNNYVINKGCSYAYMIFNKTKKKFKKMAKDKNIWTDEIKLIVKYLSKKTKMLKLNF